MVLGVYRQTRHLLFQINMNIHTFFKKEKHFKMENNSGPARSWIFSILGAIVLLLLSAVFHLFFFLSVENPKASGSTAMFASMPDTIDRQTLDAILSDRDARIANLSSATSAALASPDPSK